MPWKRHRRVLITLFALVGALVGSASGFWLGRFTLLRNARHGLTRYASDLIEHADAYGYELGVIRKTFDPSPYGFCSPEELARMQALTFQSLQVKDIGRTRDGKFYCSAFLGRLSQPMPRAKTDMLLADGTRVSLHVKLAIGRSLEGTVLEAGGVTAVLSPNAFDHWARPHLRFAVLLLNRSSGQTGQIAGEDLHIDPSWALAQERKQIGGESYRSQCSTRFPVCVVATESAIDIVGSNRDLLLESSGLGALAGLGLGLALGQFYLQRLGLARQLRRALRRDGLHLVYQPILELPSRRCTGAEALVRWSDEDGKSIAPDFFVRIAEDRGFIGEITSFVVRRATQEIGDMLRENPELTLSINIAASDLASGELFRLLDQHVRRAGIAPRQIALELTERSTVEFTVLREAVLRLHREGYQVHVDDFGTGFSSLAYLHELDVDAIKIDRAFTRTIGTDAVTASILPQMLSLAESLQLEVIVEGVETEAQAEYLIATGKRMQAQGWCFSKPVAAAELAKYRQGVESPVSMLSIVPRPARKTRPARVEPLVNDMREEHLTRH